MKILFLAFCLLPLLSLAESETESSEEHKQLALSFIRESYTVELFVAGFNASVPSDSPAAGMMEKIGDENLEHLFLTLYLEEWDTDTTRDILSFLRSDAGQELTSSALAQANGTPPSISKETESRLKDFMRTESGVAWRSGTVSIYSKISEILKNEKSSNQSAHTTPASAPR